METEEAGRSRRGRPKIRRRDNGKRDIEMADVSSRERRTSDVTPSRDKGEEEGVESERLLT